MESVLSSFPGKYTQLAEQVFRAATMILSLNRSDLEDTMSMVSSLSVHVVILTAAIRIHFFPEYLMLDIIVMFMQQSSKMFNLRSLKKVLDLLDDFSQYMLVRDSDRRNEKYMHLTPILANLAFNFAIAVWEPSLREVGTLLDFGFEWLVSQVNAHMLWRYLLCETNDGWPNMTQLILHVFSIILIDMGAWNPWPSLLRWWGLFWSQQDAGSCPAESVACMPTAQMEDIDSSSADWWWFVIGCFGVVLFYSTRPDPRKSKRDERIHNKNADKGYNQLKREGAALVPADLVTGETSSTTSSGEVQEATADASYNDMMQQICGGMVGVAQAAFPQVKAIVALATSARQGARIVDNLIAGALVNRNIGEQQASLADTRMMKLILPLKDADLNHLYLLFSTFLLCFYAYLGYASRITDCFFNSGPLGRYVMGGVFLLPTVFLLLDILLQLFSHKAETPRAPADERQEVEDEPDFADASERMLLQGYHLRQMALSQAANEGPNDGYMATLDEKDSAILVELLRFDPVEASLPRLLLRKGWKLLLGEESKTRKSEIVWIKDAYNARYLTIRQGIPVWEHWQRDDTPTDEGTSLTKVVSEATSVFDHLPWWGEALPDSTLPKKFHWVREERQGNQQDEVSVQYHSVVSGELLKVSFESNSEEIWIERKA